MNIPVNIIVENSMELHELMKRVAPELKEIIRYILIDESRNTAMEIRDNCTVKTGYMRSKIGSRPTPNGARIYGLASYTRFQERGFHSDGTFVEGKYFFRDTLENAKPRIRLRIRQAIIDYFMREM